eukprot:Unigene12133_Nuclearia_a/m.36890 Unigene12133_Nuclearia_a/g.36890  ORF Unigene12133_Nuclearia_a/g.36890 Unigene12133_Nuclearia_a/m.36890 type:complete len:348 (-) Unigene12133_Nuclearia_a:52-1095(-)
MDKAEYDEFVALFPRLVDDILSELATYALPQEAYDWFSRCIQHNVPGGKLNRGLSVAASYRSLVGERALTADEALKCGVLGWTVEWLQAFFLVADDIMDQSQTRRGQPCWYKVDGVGNVAINDSFLLESCIYKLLKKYFKSAPYYGDLVELMHETTYQTELGQLVDLITAPEEHVDLNRFSMAKYKWIVKYKTAFYSFYLPVAMAMLVAGIDKDSKEFRKAEEILLDMGEYFQVQDDYLDCFGDPAVIGKIGTDIQDNKCSWLVNKALEVASSEQRQVLEHNYGRKDAACIQRVKDLFAELKLKQLFEAYEEDSYQRINKRISELCDDKLPAAVFTKFIKKIYKRSK